MKRLVVIASLLFGIGLHGAAAADDIDQFLAQEIDQLVQNDKEVRNVLALMDEAECPICYDIIDDPNDVWSLPKKSANVCGHTFHKTCINSWLNEHNNTECPVCKTHVSNSEKAKINSGEVISIQNLIDTNRLPAPHGAEFNLKGLGIGSLDGFKNLNLDEVYYIDLSDNLIREIPADSFNVPNALIGINLSYNDIETIEVGAFRGLEELEELNLSGNNIIDVSNVEIFSHLSSMPSSQLKLDDNTPPISLEDRRAIRDYLKANFRPRDEDGE